MGSKLCCRKGVLLGKAEARSLPCTASVLTNKEILEISLKAISEKASLFMLISKLDLGRQLSYSAEDTLGFLVFKLRIGIAIHRGIPFQS